MHRLKENWTLKLQVCFNVIFAWIIQFSLLFNRLFANATATAIGKVTKVTQEQEWYRTAALPGGYQSEASGTETKTSVQEQRPGGPIPEASLPRLNLEDVRFLVMERWHVF